MSLTLDIEKGDTLLGGRFKNHKTVVKELGTDELGQPTVNGMKLLSFRIAKKMPKDTMNESYKQGFVDKCAAAGVEPEALVKWAQSTEDQIDAAAVRESVTGGNKFMDTRKTQEGAIPRVKSVIKPLKPLKKRAGLGEALAGLTTAAGVGGGSAIGLGTAGLSRAISGQSSPGEVSGSVLGGQIGGGLTPLLLSKLLGSLDNDQAQQLMHGAGKHPELAKALMAVLAAAPATAGSIIGNRIGKRVSASDQSLNKLAAPTPGLGMLSQLGRAFARPTAAIARGIGNPTASESILSAAGKAKQYSGARSMQELLESVSPGFGSRAASVNIRKVSPLEAQIGVNDTLKNINWENLPADVREFLIRNPGQGFSGMFDPAHLSAENLSSITSGLRTPGLIGAGTLGAGAALGGRAVYNHNKQHPWRTR